MNEFQLHERLAADTLGVGDFALSRILLMNDARYPWVILVPRLPGARELHELSRLDRIRLLDESGVVADCLERLFRPDKLNLGVLGNLVPQLHVHHVARCAGDPAWPGPVWGHSPAEPYPAELAEERLAELRGCLGLAA
jgi:diadenosine tetraphosphate (Ap4A) HIT family hydrolase